MPASERSIQLSKITQEFQDSKLEEQFHQHHWQERSQQNLATVFIWTLAAGVLLFMDDQPHTNLHSLTFFLIQFAGYFATRWLNRRPDYYHSYDALMTLTLTAMIMGVVSFRLLEPENSMAIAVFIMAPLIVTIALNIRFYYTLLLIGIILINYAWILYKVDLDPVFMRLVAAQMLIAVGIGLIIQRLMSASRHHDFARIINEQHLNQKITNARLAAERSNQQKSLFLAQASHDIRTPMTGVLGLSRLLQKTKLSSKQRSLLNAIEASSNSLTNLMNQLLDLSRIEQGSFKLQEKAFPPTATIENVSSLLQPLAEEKCLTIETFIAPDAPAMVHADEDRLRQILINLVSNAIQYTEQGKIGIHLKRDAGRRQQQTLIIDVTDSGAGIPSEEQGEIFNSFYQSGSGVIRNAYGLGLGLSISRELAKALNGSLTYSKTPSSRSTFTLTLPVTVLPESEYEFTCAQRSTHAVAGNILVVEDNRINSMVIKETLQEMSPGSSIDMAYDGEQAVDLCQNNDYDLILMDCVLPKMNGFTSLRQIREWERHQHTTIIAVTASAAPDDERRCHDAGFNYFLPKPLNDSDLAHILNLHLPHRGSFTPDHYDYWNPSGCLTQMAGKPKTLLRAVDMALEDLPEQFAKIQQPDITKKARLDRIHHMKGTLSTLHAAIIPSLLESLKLHADASDPEFAPTCQKIETQLHNLLEELKLWVSRQQRS